MVTPQLITYIKNKRASGTPRPEVEKLLLASGWTPQDIAEAFARTEPSPQAVAVAAPSMRRPIALSLGFILASALYAVWVYMTQGQAQPLATATDTTPQTGASAVQSAPVQDTPAQTPTPTATQPQTSTPVATPAPTPAPKPKGQYTDGTYTGSAADAYYGTVQVQATVTNGKLSNVAFLQYPNDRRTSQYINGQAMPALKSEAIQAQSAHVDIVSGATDTSDAFIQSLGSALAKAKA